MKNRGRTIRRLIEYLRSMEYTHSGLANNVAMVVSADNCVSVLDRPLPIKRRVLVSYPMYNDRGNTDVYSGTASVVIFVLEKTLAQQRTDAAEADQFSGILETVDELCSCIENDISNGVLCGFDVANTQINPEYSVFGGWLGYSIEVDFRL